MKGLQPQYIKISSITRKQTEVKLDKILEQIFHKRRKMAIMHTKQWSASLLITGCLKAGLGVLIIKKQERIWGRTGYDFVLNWSSG